MVAKNCDECKFSKWLIQNKNDDTNGFRLEWKLMECKKGHKPSFYILASNWGFKRKCEDFKLKK